MNIEQLQHREQKIWKEVIIESINKIREKKQPTFLAYLQEEQLTSL